VHLNVSEESVIIKFPIRLDPGVPRKPLISTYFTLQFRRCQIDVPKAEFTPATLIESVLHFVASAAERCHRQQPSSDVGIRSSQWILLSTNPVTSKTVTPITLTETMTVFLRIGNVRANPRLCARLTVNWLSALTSRSVG
jgi:hypothetical protein